MEGPVGGLASAALAAELAIAFLPAARLCLAGQLGRGVSVRGVGIKRRRRHLLKYEGANAWLPQGRMLRRRFWFSAASTLATSRASTLAR